MSKLGVNFTERTPQGRRGPLTALSHAILLGVCMGGLASLGLHLLGLI
jgi:hypothetical protein